MRSLTLHLPTLFLACALTGCQSPPPPDITVSGLWPEQPALLYKPFNLWTGGNVYIWPRLLSAQLQFRWAAFPRHPDPSFSAVTYDLRIWQHRTQEDAADTLVYSVDALPQPSHRVESPLPSGHWYYWTVRARFELNGQPRVTEWSYVVSPPPDRNANPGQIDLSDPHGSYFRFYLR